MNFVSDAGINVDSKYAIHPVHQSALDCAQSALDCAQKLMFLYQHLCLHYHNHSTLPMDYHSPLILSYTHSIAPPSDAFTIMLIYNILARAISVTPFMRDLV